MLLSLGMGICRGARAEYVLRALVFTAYFVMPSTPASTLVFAAAMGMLWLSVAPLVSGLVAKTSRVL